MIKKTNSIDVRLAIFFGGPSNERNISLDSARTLYDSIRKNFTENNLNLYFVSKCCNFYKVDSGIIYSNTVEDFQDKISIDDDLSINAIIESNDVFAPMIHGSFGEDGELTKLLEKGGVKAILGSNSDVLRLTLDKDKTQKVLSENGFTVTQRLLFSSKTWKKDRSSIVERVKNEIELDENGLFIIKPNDGGSSDGVDLIDIEQLDQAVDKVLQFSEDILVEKRIQGQEFSIIVLEDNLNKVLPLYPTGVTGLNEAIYSRQLKYMPGSGASLETPVYDDDELVEKIRSEAAKVFRTFGMNDWARFDGFITDGGSIIWSDLNGIPGYGQDSFFFQQCAMFSIDHQTASLLLVSRAVSKADILIEWHQESGTTTEKGTNLIVVGGGTSSERNVSRMSWANVIQKLSSLRKYKLGYIFQGSDGKYWDVPYYLTLQHTIEEIEGILQEPKTYIKYYLKAKKIIKDYSLGSIDYGLNFEPKEFDITVNKDFDFVFIALHGGDGENGSLQSLFEQNQIRYNGCDSDTSKLCMNKSKTNGRLRDCEIDKFHAPHQIVIKTKEFRKYITETDLESLHSYCDNREDIEKLLTDSAFLKFKSSCSSHVESMMEELDSNDGLVFKPLEDGCSSGVVVSKSPKEIFPLYLIMNWFGIDRIPVSILYGDISISKEEYLQMPTEIMSEILIEQFIDASPKTSIIEITVGLIGNKGSMQALTPSKTIAKEHVLTIEEKFLKGGGVNLTPPPELRVNQINSIKARIEEYANFIGVHGYSRIDAFYDCERDILYLIEVNSLPGLTAATIIYTQALLTQGLNLRPSEFLDKIVSLS